MHWWLYVGHCMFMSMNKALGLTIYRVRNQNLHILIFCWILSCWDCWVTIIYESLSISKLNRNLWILLPHPVNIVEKLKNLKIGIFPLLQWTSLQILCSSNCASFRVPSLPGYYLPGSKARKSTYRQPRISKGLYCWI